MGWMGGAFGSDVPFSFLLFFFSSFLNPSSSSFVRSPIILVNDGKIHPQPQTAAMALRDRLPVLGVELQLLLRNHVHAALAAAVAAAVPDLLFGVVAHGV